MSKKKNDQSSAMPDSIIAIEMAEVAFKATILDKSLPAMSKDAFTRMLRDELSISKGLVDRLSKDCYPD